MVSFPHTVGAYLRTPPVVGGRSINQGRTTGDTYLLALRGILANITTDYPYEAVQGLFHSVIEATAAAGIVGRPGPSL